VGDVQKTYTPPTQFGLFGILAVLLATFLGIVVFSRSNWLLNLKTAKAARTRSRGSTNQPAFMPGPGSAAKFDNAD
jgi:hypothetical protein